jgi:hypothetical protein
MAESDSLVQAGDTLVVAAPLEQMQKLQEANHG